MSLRCITLADSPALLGLWNEAAEHDQLSESLLNEKIWGDADFDSSLALVEEQESQIQAMAVAVCRQQKDGCTAYVKLLATNPLKQRQGLATRLLAAIETRLKSLGAEQCRIGESAPNYLTPGVDLRYTQAIEFFSQGGFEPFSQACNMRVDLSARSPQEVSQSDLGVIRATPLDVPAVKDFLLQHWPSWWDEVQKAMLNDPATLFIAYDGPAVVGFAAYDANNLGTGWFGPMGTAPECRGRGIGVALLKECLADMATKYPTAIIPWVGPVDFYAKHVGATMSRSFQRFRKPLSK